MEEGSFKSIKHLASLARYMSGSVSFRLIESAQRDVTASLKEAGVLSKKEADELSL